MDKYEQMLFDWVVTILYHFTNLSANSRVALAKWFVEHQDGTVYSVDGDVPSPTLYADVYHLILKNADILIVHDGHIYKQLD